MDARLEAAVFGVDPGKAGQDFISALISVVGAGDPARFLSSMESLNPGLLERVRPSIVLHDDADDNTNPSAEPTEKGE